MPTTIKQALALKTVEECKLIDRIFLNIRKLGQELFNLAQSNTISEETLNNFCVSFAENMQSLVNQFPDFYAKFSADTSKAEQSVHDCYRSELFSDQAQSVDKKEYTEYHKLAYLMLILESFQEYLMAQLPKNYPSKERWEEYNKVLINHYSVILHHKRLLECYLKWDIRDEETDKQNDETRLVGANNVNILPDSKQDLEEKKKEELAKVTKALEKFITCHNRHEEELSKDHKSLKNATLNHDETGRNSEAMYVKNAELQQEQLDLHHARRNKHKSPTPKDPESTPLTTSEELAKNTSSDENLDEVDPTKTTTVLTNSEAAQDMSTIPTEVPSNTP